MHQVLLAKGLLLPALRFIRTNTESKIDVKPARFLQAAYEASEDKTLFHTVYDFFAQRNELNGPLFDVYHDLYRQNFGPGAPAQT